MEPETSHHETDRLLGLAVRRLSLRDYTRCRHYALLAKQSDPALSGPDQILAIADVRLAAERCLPGDHLDYYSILQVPKSDLNNRSLLEKQYLSLLSLLNPSKNHFPLAEDAYNLVLRAGSVLVDPESRRQYDKEIKNGDEREKARSGSGQEMRAESCNGSGDGHGFQKNEGAENGLSGSRQEGQGGENENGNGAFWTLCPYCYYMYQYKKMYEDCCLLCQNCRKGFHAVAVALPRQRVVVEGAEYYYAFGFFPIGFDWESSLRDKKMDGGESNQRMHNVEIISDDSEDGGDGADLKDDCSQEVGDVHRAERTVKWIKETDQRARMRLKTKGRKKKRARKSLADSDSEDDSGVVTSNKDGSDECMDRGNCANAKKDSSEVKQSIAEGSTAEILMKKSVVTEMRVMHKVKSVPRNSKKMMGRLVKRKRIELEIAEELNAELRKEVGGNDHGSMPRVDIVDGMDPERYEDEFSFIWEDDDAYVDLEEILQN